MPHTYIKYVECNDTMRRNSSNCSTSYNKVQLKQLNIFSQLCFVLFCSKFCGNFSLDFLIKYALINIKVYF